jgi:hypothetical protein
MYTLDDSKNRHARKHAVTWCFIDEVEVFLK